MPRTHVAKPKHVKWDVQYVPGRGYRVVSPEGQVKGIYSSKSNAETSRDAYEAREKAVLKRMTRPCMCCQKPFESEGIHNRMCPVCRRLDGGWNPHGVAPRSGRPR